MLHISKVFAALALLFCLSACQTVVNLRTDYMNEPVGIDKAPHFSWEMSSDRYGAAQTAYRITVSDGHGVVYDSGTVNSDKSVGIAYEGPALKPCTQYRWKVEVTDERGRVSAAESTFETGLMDSGWSGAKWINSGQAHFSKYRASFDVDFDVIVWDDRGVFVFGYIDDKNYCTAEFALVEGKPLYTIKHYVEGKEFTDYTGPLGNVSAADFHKRHHFKLKVKSIDYSKGYYVQSFFNGTQMGGTVTILPYPLDEWHPYYRFNKIGFFRPKDSSAEYFDLTVSEDVWNSVLYSSNVVFDEEGVGDMHIISPAQESGAPMLRRSLDVRAGLASARLYTTAQGIYEYIINGKRLSADYFNPGSTDYRYRFMYNTYDITPYLKSGENAVCAMLGAGWWADFAGFATSWQDQFGTLESLMAKIVLTYKDGSQEVIVTDGDWKVYNQGPITSDSMQNGEDYDARREVPGWTEPGFDDSLWADASITDYKGNAVITSYLGSPASHNMTLTAVSVTEPKKGVFVYDMGQNMVGFPSVKLRGKEGQEITFQYGEMAYPDQIPEDPMPPQTPQLYQERKGLPYNENYRGALSTDHYIMKGDPDGETFQPHFTFHGYRYVSITGIDNALPLEDVKGLVVNSIGEKCDSGFETSDANVNRLYSNIVWGQRGNFVSIPTDCPQRDERMGWTGDAQVFARTATYNAMVSPFFSRWFCSVRDSQAEDGSYPDYIPKIGVPPTGSDKGGGALGWMETGIIIPWQLYQQYGDLAFLEEHYDSMVAYMKYLQNRSIGDIQPGSGYGDWVAVEHTNSPLTNTAYYAYDAMLMTKMAKALGKESDSAYYADLYNRIKVAFNREFVGEGGITKTSDNVPPFVEWIAGGSDDTFVANTQTSYVVPLQADLFDETNKPLAVRNLVDNVADHNYTLTTGFIGTPYLALVLSGNGQDDVAYKLFEQTEYPSWLYPVLQGATTIWERWNSYTIKRGFGMVDMNSFNHYSLGAVQEWMMSYMLGIQRDEENPAYKHIILQPRAGGSFAFARGHYDTVYGKVESAWERTAAGGYAYSFTVPANTTADLHLQVPSGASVKFTEGTKYAQPTSDPSVFTLPAGKYAVTVE